MPLKKISASNPSTPQQQHLRFGPSTPRSTSQKELYIVKRAVRFAASTSPSEIQHRGEHQRVSKEAMRRYVDFKVFHTLH